MRFPPSHAEGDDASDPGEDDVVPHLVRLQVEGERMVDVACTRIDTDTGIEGGKGVNLLQAHW